MNQRGQWASGVLGGGITALVVGCAASAFKVQGSAGFTVLAVIGAVMGLLFVRGQQHRPRESIGHQRPAIERVKRVKQAEGPKVKRETVVGIKAQIAKEVAGGESRGQKGASVQRQKSASTTSVPGLATIPHVPGPDHRSVRVDHGPSSKVMVEKRSAKAVRRDDSTTEDVISVLHNLGYGKKDAKAALEAVRAKAPSREEASMVTIAGTDVTDVGQLVVQCMRWMKGPRTRRLEPDKGEQTS